ncbi:MAG: uracil-DNA glycosylase [Chloroflexota bacterium]
MPETLDVIAQEVRACRRCRLCETARNGVPGEGSPTAEIMFVGEGPGQNEDAQGRPFVGAAGQLLTDLLRRAGLERSDVFITNIVKHRPPGNRDPFPDEKEACDEFLERQIAALAPKLIVTLGRHSMEKFFGPNARISQIHGTSRPWRGLSAYACFHPAAALHQPKYRQGLEEDFDGLMAALARARQTHAASLPVETAVGVDTAKSDEEEEPEQLTLF